MRVSLIDDLQGRLVNLGLMVLSVLVGLFVILLVKASIDPLRTSVNLHNFQDDEYLFEPDDVLGYKPRSHVHVTAFAGNILFDVYTDHRGGRVDRLSAQRSDHSDIIGIGGSQTWGQGVANEDTFLAIVAREVGASLSNLAVSGFGGVGSLLRLQNNLDLKPRFVIYGFWEDHLNRNLKGCLEDGSPVCVERPYYRLRLQGDGDLVLPTHSQKNLESIRKFYFETTRSTDIHRSIWTDMYWVSYEMGKRATRLLSDEDPVNFDVQDTWQATDFVMQHMNAASTSVGAELVVVWIPLYFSSDIADPPNELVALSQTLGFTLVNLRDHFLAMKQSGTDIALPGDGHMNAMTHRVLASEIITKLAVDANAF